MLDVAFLSSLLTPCNTIVHARAVEKDSLRFAADGELEDELPLLSIDSFVQDLGGAQCVVDSERVPGSRAGPHPGLARSRGPRPELEALATPPVEFAVNLPKEWQRGQPVYVHGPHGRVEVDVPPEAAPGKVLKYRLAPPPEFRIEVPPGMRPGDPIKFTRQDGVAISVPVPAGAKPGDTFEVAPPVLMVRVPEGAKPGDPVVFQSHGLLDDDMAWVRAVVPEGVAPGRYFAARLPAPPRPRDE